MRGISLFRTLFWTLVAGLCASASALEIDREYGASSYQFLKLPLSSKVIGMGGAGVAYSSSAAEIDLNPAAAQGEMGSLFLGKGFPFREFGADANHITWSLPYRSYRILVNARFLGYDDIAGYDGYSHATTPYSAHTFKGQIGLTGAYRKLHWGLTVNYALNNIASVNYSAGLVNAGLRYELFPGFHLGAAGVNGDFWTSEAEYEGNENPLPPTAVQAGASYRKTLGSWYGALAVDARTRNDEKLTFPVGLEVGWRETLFARVGYPVSEPEPDFSAGLGLRWSLFQFDYAMQRHATLSPGHYWSLGIRY